MSSLPHFGDVLSANAALFPDKPAAGDLDRQMNFRTWNERACRLANAFAGLGQKKGDRVVILAYNRSEWLEIYAATAKSGIVMVPVNFRLVAAEVRYIVQDCGATAVIVEDALAPVIEEIRPELDIAADRFVRLGATAAHAGYHDYEDLLSRASATEPKAAISADDTWALMYTSGTTGRPKGAIRSHGAAANLSLVTQVELGFSRRDTGLLVMPLCHANSLYFATSLAYCGASLKICNRPSFDAELTLKMLADGPTFTSLVPTQYTMMLEIPSSRRAQHETGRVSKLMISSAPARRELKQQVMEFFPNSGLFELYGSTEAGWVTMLQPEEQFTKLGSIGRECVGSMPIRLLDDDGKEVAPGEAGELYSHTPYTFDGYWNLPEKTAEAFRDGYCSVGDMARRDEDGFLHLIDRKSNMIISGGENVYPSEIEAVLGAHPSVLHVAAVGLPDPKWGERVHGVVVFKPGADASETELSEWCRERLAGFKRPRSFSFISEDEMPKTATGKIQHRILKARLIEREAAQ